MYCSAGIRVKGSIIQWINPIVNDFNGLEGIIEVRMNQILSFIQGNQSNYRNAIVTCKQLGYSGVATFTTTTVPLDNGEDYGSHHIIHKLECTGEEDSILQCNLQDMEQMLSTATTELRVAKISCAGYKSVKLLGGGGPHEGRLEVLFNNTWGSVCDDDWGQPDADVVCRQLGYNSTLSTTASFGQAESTEMIWLDNIKCFGNESDLLLCRRNTIGLTNCNQEEGVALICQPPPGCNSLPRVDNAEQNIVDDQATFECYEGYHLRGPPKLFCLTNGEWSEPVPVCDRNIEGTESSNERRANKTQQMVRKNITNHYRYIILGSILGIVTVLCIMVTIAVAVIAHRFKLNRKNKINNHLSTPLVALNADVE